MSSSKMEKIRSGRGRGARTVSAARLAAFNILRRVEEEGAYATVLLAANDREMRADDRALCYELVLGVLRWQLWLDVLIEHYARRKAESLDAPVRRSLRLGLYQLRFLSRNPASGVADLIERLAIETSHPQWLIERWIKAFGKDEAERFARANNEAPPVAFRIVRRESIDEVLNELSAAGASLETSKIAPRAWRIHGATALLQKLAREGKVYLQDEASQLVAHVVDAKKDERVLDVCAAPGSKTTHMATRTPDLSLLVAGDLHEHRARHVVEAARWQGIENLQIIVHDAERFLPFNENSFDRVLVDAPCTGTGTLRRNPEIRWRITALDITDLAERQKRTLNSAARMVKPDGRLIYSTCSVEPEENEEVVADFLNSHARFKLIRVKVAAALQTAEGMARVWPHRDGADGFFIAQFDRTG